MYELTTVFQEDEYGQMTSSVEDYLKTIEYDKVIIAQIIIFVILLQHSLLLNHFESTP